MCRHLLSVEFPAGWLVKQGRHAEALAVIAALEDAPGDISDPNVRRTFLGIREAVTLEGVDVKLHHELKSGKADLGDIEKAKMENSKGEGMWKLLFKNGRSQNFRRASLAVTVQCFQVWIDGSL